MAPPMKHPETPIKSPNWTGGPLGLGDPDDRSLRRVEVDVVIPMKMRDKAKAMKCVDEVKAFNECCKGSGLAMVLMCRKENSAMKDCLTQWYQDKGFQQECTDEYLQERKQYRMTGTPTKRYYRKKTPVEDESPTHNSNNGHSL